MGRIKSSLVKRTSKNLMKEENKFESDFNKNKVLLKDQLPSKSIRNKIAGYIARLKKAENKKRAVIEANTK